MSAAQRRDLEVGGNDTCQIQTRGQAIEERGEAYDIWKNGRNDQTWR